MKKLVFAFVLVTALISLSLSFAVAAMDFEDPALCVNGKWLLVDAAHPSAIQVFVPDDARYGDQQTGGCKTPAPANQFITVVKETNAEHLMRVWVDGSQASTPTITVSYGEAVQTKKNTGKGMTFTFMVR
jgi:hypothetical protein